LTDPVFDRANRETWIETGKKELVQRACEEVDQRLASYTPIQTDPAQDKEMRRLVISGLKQQTELPELPPPPEPGAAPTGPGRRGTGRRQRAQAAGTAQGA
jgi:hypothetical protein